MAGEEEGSVVNDDTKLDQLWRLPAVQGHLPARIWKIGAPCATTKNMWYFENPDPSKEPWQMLFRKIETKPIEDVD